MFARIILRVRAASFSTLLLLFTPFAANAVSFAPAYLIVVDGVPLLTVKRGMNEQGQVEITLTSLNPDKSVETTYEDEVQAYMDSLLFQQQGPSVQSGFQVVSNTLDFWAQVTNQPAQLGITLSEDPAAAFPAHYVLANDRVVDVTPVMAMGHVCGSGEVTIADENGLQAQPVTVNQEKSVELDTATITQLSASADLTATQAACMALAHAHDNPDITQTITMFGQAMEAMFSDLVTSTNEDEDEDEGITGEMNPTMYVFNPLIPVLTGGPLSIEGMSELSSSVALAFASGYGHQFTFDSARNTITQQDPPDDPNPSSTSFDYHVDENGVIDTITGHCSQQQTASAGFPAVRFFAISPQEEGVEEGVSFSFSPSVSSRFNMATLAVALAAAGASMKTKK